jgi:peptide/nickel transport system substrate-binding protein
MPPEILDKASRGLTKVLPNDQVVPDIAKKWDIKDGGKTFIFYLNDDLSFSNGKPITSDSISYNFADVTVKKLAKTVIEFKLKDKYSPFLVTVADRKVFSKDLVGASSYKVSSVKSKDGFIRSVELVSQDDKKKFRYFFYPTQASLKDAFVLGDVSRILNINDLSYNDKVSLDKFKNTVVSKQIDNDKITTVFLNNSDPTLSDKKVRKALAYSIPDKFIEGERVYTPYRKSSWAYNPSEVFKQDLDTAKSELKDSSASDSSKLKITLKTLSPYKPVASKLAESWKKLGIETKIEVVDSVPTDYQAFLGDLPLLKDPDQYTLWHSGQLNNITKYKSLRIDKLLEDGRQTYNQSERKKIYDDFQKYLVDDEPAIFLFFPYTYTLSRK